jgi:hypothetical protein
MMGSAQLGSFQAGSLFHSGGAEDKGGTGMVVVAAGDAMTGEVYLTERR